jgi:hypothetical protein
MLCLFGRVPTLDGMDLPSKCGGYFYNGVLIPNRLDTLYSDNLCYLVS